MAKSDNEMQTFYLHSTRVVIYVSSKSLRSVWAWKLNSMTVEMSVDISWQKFLNQTEQVEKIYLMNSTRRGPEMRHTDLTWRHLKKTLVALQDEVPCGICRLTA
jgi:hypothetical protein